MAEWSKSLISLPILIILSLVWVPDLGSAHVGQVKFSLRVCKVFFSLIPLMAAPPRLLSGLSHRYELK